jgi:hypothetical protein
MEDSQMRQNQKIVNKMWNVLDEAFFGKIKPKSFIKDQNLLEKYYVIKSALISEAIELYKEMGIDNPQSFLNESNVKLIKTSRYLTENIIKTNKMKRLIKEMVKSNYMNRKNSYDDIDNVVSKYVKESMMSIMIDNLLLYPVIKENKEVDKKIEKSNIFPILQSSYNMFKNEFVDIIYESAKKRKKKVVKRKRTVRKKNIEQKEK